MHEPAHFPIILQILLVSIFNFFSNLNTKITLLNIFKFLSN